MLQVDGNISPLSSSPDPHSPVLPVMSGPPPTHPSLVPRGPSSRMRTASYTLDRGKQTARLIRDTTVQDFTVVVNNNNENVNINCNVGFYGKVAVPVIQHLASKKVFVSQGVTVTCQDIVGNFDATNAQQNTVIHFRLSMDKHSLEGGSVRIHLHHTTRKVQIQGGALLPGNMKAPVWFMEKILENIFTELSQEKSLDIQQLNQTVNEMMSKSMTNKNVPTICAGCHGQFNGRSSPAFCPECECYFHKFKCFSTSKHPCHVRKRSQSCTPFNDQPTSNIPSIYGPTSTTHQISNMMQYQVAARDLTPPSGSTSLSSIQSLGYVTPTSVAAQSLSAPTTTSSVPVPTRTTSTLACSNVPLVSTTTQSPMTTCFPVTATTLSLESTARVDHQLVTTPVTTRLSLQPWSGCSRASTSAATASPPLLTSAPHSSLSCDDHARAPASTLPAQPASTTLLHDDPPLVPASTASSCQILTGRGSNQGTTAKNHTAQLNPEAIPYVTVNKPINQAKGKTKNNPKNNLATKAHEVEAELAIAEISTLQAKLQSQENEIKDLKCRNTILMERNKALEEAKNKEIYDKYFPSQPRHEQPSHPVPEQGPNQAARCDHTNHHCVQSCWHPPAAHHHCMAAACLQSCQPQCQVSADSNTRDSLLAVNAKLAGLSQAVQSLQTNLDKLVPKQDPIISNRVQPATLPDTPCPENISVLDSVPPPPHTDSPVSIDEFMFEETVTTMDTDHLN